MFQKNSFLIIKSILIWYRITIMMLT